MSDIKVSIILPVYNVENYITQCLQCLIAQTFNNIEIICVDDESTDNTMKILRDFASRDKRIKIYTQRHQFAGSARNLGLEKAVGEYVMFLDPDDYFDITMVEKLYNKINFDNTDVTLCGIYYVLKNNVIKYINPYYDTILYNQFDNAVFSVKEIKNDIWKFHVYPVNKIYRRSFLNKYDIKFQEIENTNDASFAFQVLINATRISLLNEGFYYYRFYRPNNTRLTKGKNLQAVIDAYEESYNKCSKSENFKNVKDGFLSIISQAYIWHFSNYCKTEIPENEFYYNHIRKFLKKIKCDSPNALQLLKEDNLFLYNTAENIMKYDYHNYYVGNKSNKILKNEYSQKYHKLKLFGITLYKEKSEVDVFIKKVLGIIIRKEPKIFIKNYINDIISCLSCTKGDTIYFFNDHLGETYIYSNIIKYLIKKDSIQNLKIVFKTEAQLNLFKMFYHHPFEYTIKKSSRIERILISNYLFNKKQYNGIRLCILMPDKFWRTKSIRKNHIYNEILKSLKLNKPKCIFSYPKYSIRTQKAVIKKALDIGLNLQNFIFVTPEAQSITNTDEAFWDEIYNFIKKKGFDIFINSISEIRKPLFAKHCSLTVEEAFILAEMSKGIVGIRSGLIDVFSQIKVPKYIIYNDENRILRNSILYLPNVQNDLTKEYDFYRDNIKILKDIKQDFNKDLNKLNLHKQD